MASMMASATGTLYVVATPIGNLGDITERARKTLSCCDVVCCEDTRHSGILFKKLAIETKQLLSLHKLNEASQSARIVEMLLAKADVALISDAGTPLISDPGERLVRSAISAGIKVVPIPGSSAVLAALVASGFELSRWSFEGFLHRKGPERKAQLSGLRFNGGVSVFFESPNRIAQAIADLTKYCESGRRIVVAREITKIHEEFWRGTLSEGLEHFQAQDGLKGEVILLVDAYRQNNSGQMKDEEDTFAMMDKLFSAGYSRYDALNIVQILTEAPHRDLYRMSLDIWNNAEF